MTEGRLHIGLVHPFSWPAVRRGGERYLADLAWYLSDQGHSVEVITSSEPPEADGAVAYRRCRLPSVPWLEHRGIGPAETFGVRAAPLLVRRRFDVVHALTPTAALAARASGQRTVYTVLGHPEAGVFAGRPWKRRIMALATRTVHAATVLSKPSQQTAREVLGAATAVLPPGVRADRFPPRLEPRTGPPTLLFSADLSQPQKGLDILVHAVGALLDRHRDIRVMLSGGGSPDWVWASLPSSQARTLRPVFVNAGVGSLEDVSNRYRSATVTVLPSRHEAFGLALVESLASGTPVVATTAGGMPDIVNDPAVGRLVPYGDPAALARAIGDVIDLAGRPGTPARCADHARRWHWGAVGARHVDVYRWVSRRGPRSRPRGRPGVDE